MGILLIAEFPAAAPGSLTSLAPAGRDKKVIARKVLGTVQWFRVRNRYGFINRNDTEEDAFVHQTAIKNRSPGSTFTVLEMERLRSWMLGKEKMVRRQQL